MKATGRLHEWWRQFLRSLSPREQEGVPPFPLPVGGSSPQQAGSHYSVCSNGQAVGSADGLAEAHKLWQSLTNGQGNIVNDASGEDVTPLPDDNGRYVVLDRQDQQQASYDDLPKAEQAWENLTGMQGRIVDTQTGKDVTPKPPNYLTDQEVREAASRVMGARGPRGEVFLTVNQDNVARLIGQINGLPLPVFDVNNIAGKGKELPTRTVPVKRRKVTIETVRQIVEVEDRGSTRPTGRIPVVPPTDDVDMERIRGVSDLTRVPARQLVPIPLLGRRVAGRSLHRPQYFEEVTGPAPVKKRKVWREFERPKVHEWTEDVEVSDEPRSQLLEILADVSGSMQGDGIDLAVALASVVVGKHLADGSRYLIRPFASEVGKLQRAETEGTKRNLPAYLLDGLVAHELGGGTDILTAIQQAAADVRKVATSDDRPEVLLITDGENYLTAEDVHRAIGEDVTLHTVTTQGWFTNTSLKQHSSTYYELTCADGIVKGGTGSDSPTDW